MSSTILFIFEGKKTEPNIASNLAKFFINEESNSLLKASYGFNIYQLYKKIKNDPYREIYDVIIEQINKKKDITQSDQDILDIEDYEEISDIYLFFDYDCHCSNANDAHLQEMLERFDNSQDKGLLCVSYPMVEAIRHQIDMQPNQILHSIDSDSLRGYKKWVNAEQTLSKNYHNWGSYDLNTWREITKSNLIRGNILVNQSSVLPSNQIGQLKIFSEQLNQHIPLQKIAVLSSFPFMLHDFYGEGLFPLLGER
ncbi:hypothetical protein [Vibrio sp. Vb339]|uniref:hypothetical protein n=1 Tax=Vibrio sp. Vb339 TaxID=1192013 RepID=UPI00155338EF|nr:hypothetical protein [Vibrio sp. Vb339]